MEFTWDFYPKWRVICKNGLVIPEKSFIWRKVPEIVKEHNTEIVNLELDLGYGLFQPLPKAPAYYCSYKMIADLGTGKNEEIKIIGWGAEPLIVAAYYAPDGTYFYHDIKNPQEPFLLKIR